MDAAVIHAQKNQARLAACEGQSTQFQLVTHTLYKPGLIVSGDADAWCATYKFDKQSALPRKALPSDGIVPFLLKANPVENQFVDFKLIPSELYIG